jgi:CheY-like chemotaxis protein
MNIPEARVAMRSLKPAAVALDRFLEGEDSLFYIQELKAGGYQGPIIVIGVVDDEKSALDAGADRFLAKPIAPFKLTITLKELLEGELAHTVLLADDDGVTRYILGEALSRLGYNVLEAQNGREAIQMMEKHILTGVFLDVIMPALTGLEVLREMRRNSYTATIPVIVHTSKELSPQEMDELTNLGAVFYAKREFSNRDGSGRLQEILASAGIGL